MVLPQDRFSEVPFLQVRVKAYVHDRRFEGKFQSDITVRAKAESQTGVAEARAGPGPSAKYELGLDMGDRDEELVLKDRALEAAAEGIVIADARLPDMPLIYVNSGFERVTGYDAESVLGRNCRFLQGPGTEPAAAAEIRQAILEERACLVEILNYRKDGTPFWNRLSITPVRDSTGQVTHFIGVQSDITVQKNAEEALLQAKSELETVNRRMRLELEMAAGIQQTLLPPNDQVLDHVELCWQFRPCVELAGDTLNIIPLDEHRIAFYVIDVSGHGVASALLSVTLSRWLASLPFVYCAHPLDREHIAAGIYSPADVALRLNRQFLMTPEAPQYFTMLYGILDQHSGELRYVCAGHPSPVLVRENGEAACPDIPGFPVGLLRDAEFQDHTLQLHAGDRLYVYTDGVTEAANANGEDFGLERCRDQLIQDRCLPLSQSLESLVAALAKWRGTSVLHDDITLLALQYRP